MELNLNLEKQLLPVHLTTRRMASLALLTLVPIPVYLLVTLFQESSAPVWYLWTAVAQGAGVVTALLVAVLCFIHYRRVGEVSVPVMALGLLAAGAMDLAQLIGGLSLGAGSGTLTEPGRQAVLFAFTASRAFYAFTIMAAAAFAPLRGRYTSESGRAESLRLVLRFALVYLAVGGALMFACFSADEIVEITFSNRVSLLAVNLAPVVLYLLAGCYVLPVHFSWHRQVFGQVLIVSTVPLLVSHLFFLLDAGQLGSSFFMAVLMSVIAYTIPFIGLMVDYWKTYSRLQEFYATLRDRMLVFEQTRQVSERGNELFTQLMRQLDVPVLVLDTSRRITRVSDTLAVQLGLNLGSKALPQLALARSIDKVLGAEALQVLEPYFERVQNEHKAQELETALPIQRVDALRGLKWRLVPVLDSQHRLVAYLLVGNHA